MLDEGFALSATRIRGARVATGPDSSAPKDLFIAGGRFCRESPPNAAELDLSGHLVLPGLINAHEHLELNLFPRLGTRLYANASEWAADVYRPDCSPVQEHQAVPKSVRLAWGAIKNLLSGVTTVAHHNPYEAEVFDHSFPVRVVREFGWAHSLEFSDDIGDRYARTPADMPFIVHAAEGADPSARREIERLDQLGVLSGRTVLIHANAVTPGDLALIRTRRCSIVWCPTSNLATYGNTLPLEALTSGIPVALGTDSAITAETDLLREIRIARRHSNLASSDVYRMVTTSAADILRLNSGQGQIREGGVADIIAVADEGQTPAEAIFDLRPRLVMIGGEIRLTSGQSCKPSFHPIEIEQRGRWWIDADIPRLTRAASTHIGPDFRLAGKLVGA